MITVELVHRYNKALEEECWILQSVEFPDPQQPPTKAKKPEGAVKGTGNTVSGTSGGLGLFNPACRSTTRCNRRGKPMVAVRGMDLWDYKIDGWTVGNWRFFDADQAQRALLSNRMKMRAFRSLLAKLGQHGSE